jgi:hypothetical protein
MEMPTYDTQRYCYQVNDVTVGGSEKARVVCLHDEQAEHDSLKVLWERLPGEIGSICGGMARLAGGSFQALTICVDDEM